MEIQEKISKYILYLRSARKLEEEIREYYIKKCGIEIYQNYIEDIIVDNMKNPDLEGTLKLIDQVLKENNMSILE